MKLRPVVESTAVEDVFFGQDLRTFELLRYTIFPSAADLHMPNRITPFFTLSSTHTACQQDDAPNPCC